LSNQQWPQQLKPNSLLETRADSLLLAEHLSCPLATLDKDLRKAAKKRGVAIAALDQQ
jgi:rRNA-processing protein FCF1